MEFLKAAPGVKFDVRDERRICVELQFTEMKRARNSFSMVQKQIAKWTKVVRAAGIEAE